MTHRSWLLAERVLDIEILKEINAKKMVSPLARREQLAFVCARGLGLLYEELHDREDE